MKKITVCGITTCICLVLSYIEHLIPLSVIIPLPGIKLGLSNIVILTILVYYGIGYAGIIMILKCVMSSFFFGSITTLAFSLSGGCLSLLIMFLLIKLLSGKVSVYGISIAGAVFHNVGQICACAVIMKTRFVFTYLPFLIISGIIMGTITGVVTAKTLKITGYTKETSFIFN